MHKPDLHTKRVAILATDGFEQSELLEPRDRLREAGARVDVVSPKADEIQGFEHFKQSARVKVDRRLRDAAPEDYDALVIPGGLFNPDQLRTDEHALRFTRHFFDSDKPVAAVCHGPWVLINAEVVEGRTLTSWPAIRKDVENAGGRWVDEQVVVDGQLVSSRRPSDLGAFCDALIDKLDQASPRAAAG